MAPLSQGPSSLFGCTACFRRALRSLATHNLQTTQLDIVVTSQANLAAITSATSTSIRGHATFANLQKGHHIRTLREALRSPDETPWNRRNQLKPSGTIRRNDQAKEANRHLLHIQKDDEARATLWSSRVDRSLQKELNWTGGDALKLAQTVLAKLRAGEVERALEMVRASEQMPVGHQRKGVDNVVSWNHIMDYYMSKRWTRDAFKIFNEMKKRGHRPDAHTYTIMLRGYGMYPNDPHAVEQAMKVYDSMWRPESNIKPSIIHSNAIINCLGRALNLDALWSVAGRLPDRGPGSADKWTYTTILNTMQACAARDAQNLAAVDGNETAASNALRNAISEGRRLWEDIVSRWRSGDVHIDETLVCAMGRLLLLGQRREWEDIFSLVHQTMQLPRPKAGRGGQRTSTVQGSVDVSSSTTAGEEQELPGLGNLAAAVAEEGGDQVNNEFAVVDLSDRGDRPADALGISSPYASARQNTLSLLMEAALRLKDVSTGKAYWDRLTNPDNEPCVLPDADNLHIYMRLLRISRSSRTICDLLRQPSNASLEGIWYRRTSFVLAMSTCARDFKNPNVFNHASTILDLMQANLPKPDIKLMTMYLSLAMVTTPGISTEIEGHFNGRQGENNLIRAIQRFHYSGLDYRLMVEKWIDEHKKEKVVEDQGVVDGGLGEGGRYHRRASTRAAASESPDEILEFLQNLNSAYDKLLGYREKLTEKMATALMRQKQELSKVLHKMNTAVTPMLQAEFQRRGDGYQLLGGDDKSLMAKGHPDQMAVLGRDDEPDTINFFDQRKQHCFLEQNDRYKRDGSPRHSHTMAESARARRVDWDDPRRPRLHGYRRPNQGNDYGEQPRWSSRSSSSSPDDRLGGGRGRTSNSLAQGWGAAWNNSVETEGGDKERKSWMVV